MGGGQQRQDLPGVQDIGDRPSQDEVSRCHPRERAVVDVRNSRQQHIGPTNDNSTEEMGCCREDMSSSGSVLATCSGKTVRQSAEAAKDLYLILVDFSPWQSLMLAQDNNLRHLYILQTLPFNLSCWCRVSFLIHLLLFPVLYRLFTCHYLLQSPNCPTPGHVTITSRSARDHDG